MPDKSSRYTLHPSSAEGWWVATDTKNGLVCKFKQGLFNTEKEFTGLGFPPSAKGKEAALFEARIARELTDWLFEAHPDLLFFPPDFKQKQRKRIGETIRDLREDEGVSLRHLAHLIGIDPGHLSRLESGRYGVSLDTLAKIAEVFGYEIDFCEKEDLDEYSEEDFPDLDPNDPFLFDDDADI